MNVQKVFKQLEKLKNKTYRNLGSVRRSRRHTGRSLLRSIQRAMAMHSPALASQLTEALPLEGLPALAMCSYIQ